MRAAALTAVLGLVLGAAPGWAACATGEAEPNNGQSQAQAGLCSGQALSGSIGSSSDVDWYEVSVGAAGTLAVSLDHSTADDFDWYLYRATGPSVASGTTSQVPEAGSYAAPAAGTYYLEVVRYRGTAGTRSAPALPAAARATTARGPRAPRASGPGWSATRPTPASRPRARACC